MRLLFLFVICSSLSLSDFFSQVKTYSFELGTKSYSLDNFDASPQIFDITQDRRGVMYFANQNGFLEYDGSEWRNINTKPKTEINTIEKDNNGIIYAGGFEDFGYLYIADSGVTKYRSLKTMLHDSIDFKKISSIKINSENKVFFLSQKYVFIYQDDKIDIISAQENEDFHEAFLHKDKFYVNIRNKGICVLNNGGFELIEHGDFFSDKKVFSMNNFNERLLVLSNKKIYDISDHEKPKEIYIEDLNDLSLYGSLIIDNKYLSIGTFGKGVYLLDKDFKVKYLIDQKSGLLDGVILCQYIDKEGNLWIGTNNGVSKILINSPISLYNLKENKISTIESIIEFHDEIFFANYTGVYYSLKNDFQSGLNKLHGIKVDCYGFMIYSTPTDTILLIAAVDGVFSYNKMGVLKFIAKCSPYNMMTSFNDPSRIIVCNYKGLSSIRWNGEEFEDEGFVSNFNEDVYNFEYDDQGNLYIGSKKKGPYKTSYKVFDDHTIPIENISEEVGISNGHAYIAKIDGNIFIGSNNGLYVKSNNQWKKTDILGNPKHKYYGIHRINQLLNGDVWMVTYNDKNIYEFEVGFAKKNNEGYHWYADDFKNYSDELVHSIYRDKAGIVWLGGVKHIYRFDPSFKKSKSSSFYTLIRKIKWGNVSYFNGGYKDLSDTSKILSVYEEPIVYDYGTSRLEFQFSSSSFLNENKNEYSYILEGYDNDWSQWKSESKCDYTNLPEGKYTFRVKSRNYIGNIGKETVFEFIILPPWYRTIWAYAIYFSLFLLLIYLGVKLGTIRIQKQKQLLEKVVKDRTQEVILQKNEIEGQREELQELYNDVTDSIRYAKRLQDSILPPDQFIKDLFPDSFVYYRPKDIVSGDFYWAHQSDGKNMIAAVDCTGHGVPGAFMSLVGANGLNAAVQEQKNISPARILNDLNSFSYSALNKDFEGETVRDGMDMAIICLDAKKKKLSFSGASNPIYKVSDGELEILKGDRFAIGSFVPGEKEFSELEVSVKKDDMIYLFSDGYPDQFGGLKGKKFMGRNFRALLIEVSKEDTQRQQEIIHQRMEAWRGEHEQIDDILVIGIRIS